MTKAKQQAKHLICPILEMVVLLFLAPLLSLGQATALGSASVYTGVAQKSNGTPASNASVRICTNGASGNPCSPVATIYQDFSLLTPKTNPLTTDSIGNFTFFANPDKYLVQVSGTGVNTYSYYTVPGITSFGYWITPGSGLAVDITQGRVWCNGSIQTYAGGTLALTANATNYIYLSTVSPCAPATDTVGFSNTKIPLQIAVTGNSTVNSITDQRTYLGTQLVPAGASVFNVQAYGAQGIGPAHDDTTAVTNAIAAAGAVSGGTVYFPCTSSSGNGYFLTSPISIAVKVKLQGCLGSELKTSSYIQNAGTEDMLDFVAGSEGSEIIDLGFYVAVTATAGSAVSLNLVTIDDAGLLPFTIKNVVFNGAWNNLKVMNVNGLYMSNINSVFSPNSCLLATGGLSIYISDSFFGGCARSDIELTGGSGFFWSNVQTFAGGHGLLVDPDASHVVSQIFSKSFVADSVVDADAVVFSGAGPIVQIEFQNSWVNATNPPGFPFGGGFGINFLSSNLDDFKWIGGWIRSCYLAGVNITAGKNISFTSTYFSANGHNNPSQQPGVQVAANVNLFHITNSVFGAVGADDLDVGNQNPGLLVASGTSSGWSFSGNTLSGGPAGSTLLMDHSTGAKFVDLRGSVGASQEVSSGTLAIGGSTTVNLATFVPTPAVSQKQGSHAIFRVINGSTGSVSMGSIDLSITHDGCNAQFVSNIPTVGSGFQSISGCTLTLNNASGTVSSPWGVWLVEVDTIGF